MIDSKNHLIKWKCLVSILDLLSNCESGFSLMKKEAADSAAAAPSDEGNSKSQCEEVIEESQIVNVFEKKLTSSLLELLKMSRMANKRYFSSILSIKIYKH